MIHASRERRCPDTMHSVSWRLIGFIVLRESCGRRHRRRPAAVFAQASAPPPETRAELLRRLRDEKEKSLTAYERNGLERALNTVETRVLWTSRARWRASEVRQSRHGQRVRISVSAISIADWSIAKVRSTSGRCDRSRDTGRSGQLRHDESRWRVADAGYLRATPGLPASRIFLV